MSGGSERKQAPAPAPAPPGCRRRWLRSDEKKKASSCSSPPPKSAAPLAFFKIMHTDFGNVLFIPPKFVHNVDDLTGHDVYLEDSEGNSSKVRIAKVDGSLAFQQGWNDFVVDHSIKLGELLLFQYTSKSLFSVRVFGVSACERKNFHVESKIKRSRKKRKESSLSLDDLHPHKRSLKFEDVDGNHCVSGEDPKRKEPETNLDGSSLSNDGHAQSNLAAKDTDADPTPQVIINTGEDPKRIETEITFGSSGAPCQKDGEDVKECEAEAISASHQQENTKIKAVANTDPGHAMQENEFILEFSRVPRHEDDKDVVKELEAEVNSLSHNHEMHDSNDVENEQEKVIFDHLDLSEPSTVQSKCFPVDNHELLLDGNVCVRSESAREGKCLENSIKGQMALNDSGLPKMSTSEEPGTMDIDPMSKHDAQEFSNHENFGGKSACTTQKDIRCEVEDMISPEEMACHFFLSEEGTCNAEGIYGILDDNLGTELGTSKVDPVDPCLGNKDANAHVNPTSDMPNGKSMDFDKRAEDQHARPMLKHSNDEKGATTELQTKMEHLKPIGNVGSRKGELSMDARKVDTPESGVGHEAFQKEDGKFTHNSNAETLRPVKAEPLDFDDNTLLRKLNFSFSISSTTQTWLELPKLPPNVSRRKKQDRKVVMLTDPLMRVWPILYHDSVRFVGFTSGWKTFVAANNLQQGDFCELFEVKDGAEQVYRVQITKA